MVPGFSKKEIKPAKTVGQRLKAARKARELTLEEAEQKTKVKLKYLQALEQDRHDLLPTEVYSLGFLRCYGEVLGLNTKKLLEQYQLERQAFKSAKGSAQSLTPRRTLTAPRFLITPKILVTAASIGLVIGLVWYVASGVQSFLAPPKLKIDEPKPDSRVTTSMIMVEGETDPAASLSINSEVIAVDPSGKFKQEIAIIPGINTLEFLAVNRVGKETKQIRKVLADFKVETEPTTLPGTPSPSPSPSPTASVSPSATPSVSPSPRVSPKVTPSASPTSTSH